MIGSVNVFSSSSETETSVSTLDRDCNICGEMAYVACPHRGNRSLVTPQQPYSLRPPQILWESTLQDFGGISCIWYPRERGIKGFLDPKAVDVHIACAYSLHDVLTVLRTCKNVRWISGGPSTIHVLKTARGFMTPQGVGARVRRFK